MNDYTDITKKTERQLKKIERWNTDGNKMLFTIGSYAVGDLTRNNKKVVSIGESFDKKIRGLDDHENNIEGPTLDVCYYSLDDN